MRSINAQKKEYFHYLILRFFSDTVETQFAKLLDSYPGTEIMVIDQWRHCREMSQMQVGRSVTKTKARHLISSKARWLLDFNSSFISLDVVILIQLLNEFFSCFLSTCLKKLKRCSLAPWYIVSVGRWKLFLWQCIKSRL